MIRFLLPCWKKIKALVGRDGFGPRVVRGNAGQSRVGIWRGGGFPGGFERGWCCPGAGYWSHGQFRVRLTRQALCKVALTDIETHLCH
jgi:hypothetical protein